MSRASATLPQSIPDTQMGLSAAELRTFRQHQSIALAAPPSVSSSAAYSHSHRSGSATRGRGSARSSGASSRAASAASSAGGAGGQGRLLLDAGSLNVLGAYFERLMSRIQERVDYLTLQTEQSTIAQSRRAATTIAAADYEIARFKDLLRQIDELEAEFDKIRHIRDIVKTYRARVESLSRTLRR